MLRLSNEPRLSFILLPSRGTKCWLSACSRVRVCVRRVTKKQMRGHISICQQRRKMKRICPSLNSCDVMDSPLFEADGWSTHHSQPYIGDWPITRVSQKWRGPFYRISEDWKISEGGEFLSLSSMMITLTQETFFLLNCVTLLCNWIQPPFWEKRNLTLALTNFPHPGSFSPAKKIRKKTGCLWGLLFFFTLSQNLWVVAFALLSKERKAEALNPLSMHKNPWRTHWVSE